MNPPYANTCCSQQQIFYRTLYECNNTDGSFFFAHSLLSFLCFDARKKSFILFRVFDYFVWLFNICCICGAVSNDRVDKQTHKKWLVNIWGRYVFFPFAYTYADHQPTTTKTTTKDPNKSVYPTPNYYRFFCFILFVVLREIYSLGFEHESTEKNVL